MRALVISTYELGRPPFGVASALAALAAAGVEARGLDLAVEPLDEHAVRDAHLIAFHVPMHTATRLAARQAPVVRRLNPTAHLCFFGLYAPPNAPYLTRLGADTLLGPEFEDELAALARRLAGETDAATAAVAAGAAHGADGAAATRAPGARASSFATRVPALRVPDRRTQPALERYARLDRGDGRLRLVGATETTRGCRHHCRHCPIVPVYRGHFRLVPAEVVLADVRQQVAVGAEHLTFGDPDFLNGPRHALAIAEAVHAEHPALTWDATIKVEHLLAQADLIPRLKDLGCLFVTTAVESFDDRVLEILAKRHTREDVGRLARLFRDAGLAIHPTFVAFHPWTTTIGYMEFLDALVDLDWVESTAPIQLAIRLLIPAGSLLLEHPEVRAVTGAFDEEALVHPWTHPDPAVDALQRAVLDEVHRVTAEGASRAAAYERVYALAARAARAGGQAHLERAEAASGGRHADLARSAHAPKRAPVPFLTEPWYC